MNEKDQYCNYTFIAYGVLISEELTLLLHGWRLNDKPTVRDAIMVGGQKPILDSSINWNWIF